MSAAVTGAGEIAVVHMIFGGRTTAVLPPLEIRAKYPTIHFAHTENHWCDALTKRAFMKRVWEWKVTRYMLHGLSRADAEKAPYIHFLDCWPVNLTEEFRGWVRTECSGVLLRFQPAGGTDKYQVNDTHLHAPLKRAYLSRVQSWYRGELSALLARHEAGSMEPQQYIDSVARLMSLPVLRILAPSWLLGACEELTRIREDGRNLIAKGFDQNLLLAASDPDAQRGWLEAAAAARASKAAAALQAAAAAQAAKAGASAEVAAQLESAGTAAFTSTFEAKQAEGLSTRDALGLARAAEAAAKAALQAEHDKATAAASAAAPAGPTLPALLLDMARQEMAFHMANIPTPPANKRKPGAATRPNGAADARAGAASAGEAAAMPAEESAALARVLGGRGGRGGRGSHRGGRGGRGGASRRAAGKKRHRSESGDDSDSTEASVSTSDEDGTDDDVTDLLLAPTAAVLAAGAGAGASLSSSAGGSAAAAIYCFVPVCFASLCFAPLIPLFSPPVHATLYYRCRRRAGCPCHRRPTRVHPAQGGESPGPPMVGLPRRFFSQEQGGKDG